MTTGRINQVVELMLPRMQADSPKYIQLRCCHHILNMGSITAAHIDNFECGVLERVFSTSVAFHTVSSACAQYYNEVSELLEFPRVEQNRLQYLLDCACAYGVLPSRDRSPLMTFGNA